MTTETNDVVNQYFSSQISMNFVCKDGTPVHFVNGRATTCNPEHVAELDFEVKRGHPFIRVVKGQETISAKLLDPLEALKEKLRQELLAEMRSGPEAKDFGNSVKLDAGAGGANSQTVADGVNAPRQAIKVPAK